MDPSEKIKQMLLFFAFICLWDPCNLGEKNLS